MLPSGIQFFIEVFCILQARSFKVSGNDALSLDARAKVKFFHIIAIVTILQLFKDSMWKQVSF